MSWEQEIAEAAWAQLSAQAGLWGLLVVLGGALLALEWALTAFRPGASRWVARAVMLAAAGAGVWRAWGTKWLCDDAFITFRYSKNLAQGLGLVFNEGEWVEGYTNFAWAYLLGWVGRLGGDIPSAAVLGDLAALVVAVVASGAAVRRACEAMGVTGPAVPFASVVLGGSVAFTTYGTSGLETMPAAALVALGVWSSVRGDRPWLSGLWFGLATLTRPDHVLYAVAMGLGLVVSGAFASPERGWKRLPWRGALEYALAFAALFGPWWLWRWRAYGDFYPNTYYAKSGDVPYVSQGLVYLAHFVATSGAWLAVPAAVLAFSARARHAVEVRLRVFAVASALLVGTYVVRVGGDFMEYRFFVALVPVLAIALEVAVRSRWALGRPSASLQVATLAAVVAGAVAVTPVKLLGPGEKRWNLANEATFYPLTSVRPVMVGNYLFAWGTVLSRVFPAGGPQPRVATGCVGMVGYYSTVPVVDLFGLANRRIAHKVITQRGRPGHEKLGNVDDALAEGAVLTTDPLWGPDSAKVAIGLPGIELYLLRADESVLSALARGGARVPDLRGQLQALLHGPREEALAALPFWSRVVGGTPLEAELLAPLRARLGVVEDFEAEPRGLTVSGTFAVRAGATPPGLSGAKWLASAGVGEAVLTFEVKDSGTVRFQALGRGGADLAVRLEQRQADGTFTEVATLRDLPGERAATLGFRLPVRQGTFRLVAVDRDGRDGADLALDDVHLAPPDEEQALSALSQLEGAAFLSGWREFSHEAERDHPLRAQFEGRFARHVTFDEPSWPTEAVVRGTGFEHPLEQAAPNQQPIAGARGPRFLDSFGVRGDQESGALELPLPDVAHGSAGKAAHVTASVLVGGSADCQRVFVGLKVGDVVVARACGANDERLRPVILEADVAEGQALSFVAVDDSTGPWGHLLADDLVVLKPRE